MSDSEGEYDPNAPLGEIDSTNNAEALGIESDESGASQTNAGRNITYDPFKPDPDSGADESEHSSDRDFVESHVEQNDHSFYRRADNNGNFEVERSRVAAMMRRKQKRPRNKSPSTRESSPASISLKQLSNTIGH